MRAPAWKLDPQVQQNSEERRWAIHLQYDTLTARPRVSLIQQCRLLGAKSRIRFALHFPVFSTEPHFRIGIRAAVTA